MNIEMSEKYHKSIDSENIINQLWYKCTDFAVICCFIYVKQT